MLATTACKKKSADSTAAPAGSGSAEPTTASIPAPTPPPAAPAAPKVGEGPVASAKTLFMIDLPPFPGVSAPGKARWAAAYAEKDGDRWANYKEGNEGFVSVRFLDCNSPTLKKYIDNPERGDFDQCFKTPAADAPKIKNYPRLDTPDETQVVIRVGHVVVISDVFEGHQDQIKKDDIVKYLATADFSTIEQ